MRFVRFRLHGVERARIADGARLHWQFKLADGRKVVGDIYFPSLRELQAEKACPDDLAWELAPSASPYSVLWDCEYERESIWLLDQSSGYCVRDPLTLDEVYGSMLACLGVKGWAVEFVRNGEAFELAAAVRGELAEALPARHWV